MDFRSVCEVYVCCGLRVIACCPFLAHRTQQGGRVHRSECLFLCPHSKHTSPPALPDVRALTSMQPNQRNAQCEANKRELILKTLCTTKKPMNAGSVLLKQLQYKHIFLFQFLQKRIGESAGPSVWTWRRLMYLSKVEAFTKDFFGLIA